jgi:hypothetical protein
MRGGALAMAIGVIGGIGGIGGWSGDVPAEAAGAVAEPATAVREEVRLQVPEGVVFPVIDLRAKSVAGATRLTFDQARLAPGNRLRISVRAEGLDLGTGAPARISYAAHGPGGTSFDSSLRDTGYTPVFESNPGTLAGSVEIAWTLEPPGRFERAGNHAVSLRWKAESIPDPARRPGPAGAVAGSRRGAVGGRTGLGGPPVPAPTRGPAGTPGSRASAGTSGRRGTP